MGYSYEVSLQVKATVFTNFFVVTDPLVLAGILLGACLPFLFAALTMLSVGKAATGIILEVRRQLNAKPLLRKLAVKTCDDAFMADPVNGFKNLATTMNMTTKELEDCKPD